MIRLGRSLGRGLARPRFQGIRFRLGVAMAFALLPVIVLAIVQMQTGFREQSEARAQSLRLAASRASLSAKARLDSTVVLLDALTPETLGPYCGPRLAALVQRLDGYIALYRMSATGAIMCSSRAPLASSTPAAVRARSWFQRVRAGEHSVIARAVSPRVTDVPAVIVAVRAERPMGRFDGAMTATIPLEILQPDVADPALPDGAEAALTDAHGNILVLTDPAAFALKEGRLGGWVAHVRADSAGAALFETRVGSGERRVFSAAPLTGRDVYVVLSAPSPGLWSWAVLNPIGNLLLPLGAWLTAFAAVYARGRFSIRPVQAVHAPTEIRVLADTLDDLAETITTRDKALLDALKEKDALMREIHHRVKNNLQIISSLLSMQQRTLRDEPARAAIGDTRQRIAALALIYRTLYQSADLRYADAHVFLNDLVGQLVASEALRGPLVTSSVQADSLIIDPDKLAPLALWLVEAVSNAQKHAFAGRGGRLQVRFRVQGETSVLEVEDDGPGTSNDQAEGVGRTLMGAFAKQLRGEAELIPAPGGGTIARMVFATPEAAVPADPSDVARSEAGT